MVYDGTVQFNQTGWKVLDLATTFPYNNTDNLLVLTESNLSGSVPWAQYPLFRWTTSTNRVLSSRYSTQSNADNGSPNRNSQRPNIRIRLSSPQPELSPPANLSAVPGNQTVTLSWDPPQYGAPLNLQSYRVYRNGILIAVMNPAQTDFTDSGLLNGVAYSFYVTAMYNLGESVPSETVIATPVFVPVLLPPQQVSIEIADDLLSVSWDIDIMASAYLIEGSQNPYSGFEDITDQGSFYYEDGRVNWLTTRDLYPLSYYFRVRSQAR